MHSELEQLAQRLKRLGMSLPACSHKKARQQLASLIADISLAIMPNGTAHDALEAQSILRAIRGVTEFNGGSSPVKLELWGTYHGKYFVVQGQPEVFETRDSGGGMVIRREDRDKE